MLATSKYNIQKFSREFLPDNFLVESWDQLEPYYINLLNRKLSNYQEFYQWMLNWSELDAIVSEDAGWRYIKMTCDTTDSKLSDAYKYFIEKIQPNIATFQNKLNKKFIESEFRSQLDEQDFKFLIKNLEKELKLFREENIPLFAEEGVASQEYAVISGAQTVEWEGQELTLQQAAVKLKDLDRKVRETVWKKMKERCSKDEKTLDLLLDKLIGIRNSIASNCGFENYRDYKFQALGRFDYTAEDCINFHESVNKVVVPLLKELDLIKKSKLKLDELLPWDTEVDEDSKTPLKPFATEEELVSKTMLCMNNTSPKFGDVLRLLYENKHLDLSSRKGKAPGGYNYPLYETGLPFIFMNAAGMMRDVVVLLHESGHALHNIVTHNYRITEFKSTPSEVAELASMSMELITMDNWDVFFENKDDVNRAKRDHLKKVLSILPWIAMVDKFQHWIYLNKNHTAKNRSDEWLNIVEKFSTRTVNWNSFENYRRSLWQSQLHIFEVPFYYIEYGFAQLGAIAIWKNFKENKDETITRYIKALSLGSTRSIPDVYKAAGISFDFSEEYVSELIQFVKEEYLKLV